MRLERKINFEHIWLALALLVFASIGLHALGLHHEHPSFMGDGLTAALHGEEKKYAQLALPVITQNFALIIVAAFFGSALLRGKTEIHKNYWSATAVPPRAFGALFQALASGVIHPKIF